MPILICTKKDEYPMDGRCNSVNVLYQANIVPREQRNDTEYTLVFSLGTGNKNLIIIGIPSLIPYIGIKLNFRNIFGASRTGEKPLKWSKNHLKKSSTANSFNSSCNLYLEEKINPINFKDTRRRLDKRNELIFKCKHKKKNLN